MRGRFEFTALFDLTTLMEGLTMRGKLWVLSVAAVLMWLTITPAMATSSCGYRSDLSRGPRLTILGLTADQRLVQFQECQPGRLYEIGRVYGLQSPDTALVGIDFRVQNGQLYGVGDDRGIYTIDPDTAAATQVSQLTVSLDGTVFGVDFNPAADRLRLTSNTGQNLAHNVNLGGTTVVNTALNYPAPVNINPATGVTGAAYTNNDLSDRTGTTLFDIDTVLNQVAIQSPPGQGALVAVGALTVDPDTPVGFDIYTDLRDGVAFTNRGFASLVVGGVTGFYRVNVLTGQAFLIGTFDAALIDIAIPLNQ
jgi:hypothetical protein